MDTMPSATTQSYAGRLATWAAELRFKDLPHIATEQLKVSVLDALGCALYGFKLPSTQIALRAMRSSQVDHSGVTVWGSSSRYEPMSAAMVNGAAIQSFELDDVHGEAMLHGSSAMLPAVLAIADLKPPVSGDEMLTALAVGWEVGVRVNRCMGSHILARGWHGPTIFGTIAAALAAGRALRLDPMRLTNCLVLGVVQASGLLVVQYGGMAKRLYAGCAARAGVLAALLAEQGFTAPEDALEHPIGGFIHTFAQGEPVYIDELIRGLGNDFAASKIAFKLYANCAAMHPALDALAALCARHPQISADNIAHIKVSMTEHGVKHVGWPYAPGTATTAQFNIGYGIAVHLLEGNAFVHQYRDELLAAPRVLDLVDRIEVVHAPDLESVALGARNRCRLNVTVKNGEVFESEGQTARGRPEDPISWTDIVDKFNTLSEERLNPAQRSMLIGTISRLELVGDTTTVTGQMSP